MLLYLLPDVEVGPFNIISGHCNSYNSTPANMSESKNGGWGSINTLLQYCWYMTNEVFIITGLLVIVFSSFLITIRQHGLSLLLNVVIFLVLKFNIRIEDWICIDSVFCLCFVLSCRDAQCKSFLHETAAPASNHWRFGICISYPVAL